MCVIFFLLGVFLSVFEQMGTGVGQPARKKSGTGKKERERSKKVLEAKSEACEEIKN